MSVSYDTLGLTLTVRAAGSQVTVGTEDALVLVGGYDSANAAASVTAGNATLVDDPTNAEDQFGTSELSRVCQVAAANRCANQYAVPVPETSNTETVAASSSGTLTNAPIFDPRVHPDHSIDVAEDTTGDGIYDTTITVEYVQADAVGDITSPSADTVRIDPATGVWKADASGDYEFSYTYGDYSAAIKEAVTVTDGRYIYVGTENDSVKSTLQTELANVATDFRFKRGIVPSQAEIDPASVGSYTPAIDDWRVAEVAPARAQMADGEVRTAAAVAGLLTIQPIHVEGSVTYDTLSGIISYETEYRPSQAEGFGRVTAVADTDTIAQAVTTSSTDQFSEIYVTEIVDLVALGLQDIVNDYKGGGNTQDDRRNLASDTRLLLDGYWKNSPPIIATGKGTKPYTVSQSLGANDTTTNLNVGVEPAPIMKEVNLDINVGDVVTFGGASA